MDMYTYARKRLFARTEGRQEFLTVLVKRLLKSVARSTGARIHTNKWVRLVDLLATSYPDDKGPKMLADISEDLNRYRKSHPKTAVRLDFLINYIKQYRIQQIEIDVRIFNTSEGAFESEGDTDWLYAVARKHRYIKTDCGHWAKEYEIWKLRGDQESYEASERCCPMCAEHLISSGERVSASGQSQTLILASHAVEYFSSNQQSLITDRRDPLISFNAERQIWHDRHWSPYAGLVDGYHTSQRKGFKVIESPWYFSNRRAFGCELEVQVTRGEVNDVAGRVHDALNPSGKVGEYCYFERDGSIGTGFEMITQPAGLDTHREMFAKFLQNDEMKRGMRSHEGGSCGFHVHVGKQYLTQTQIYRVQSFLNDVRNESLIRAVARRYDSGFSKFKPQMAKFTSNNKKTGDRYEALNVTNEKTVEFRIFRGSLRYESIMAALEFCNAVLTFCTPGVTSFVDFTALGFKKFIMSDEMKADTKFLRSYLSLDQDRDNEQSRRTA